MRYVDLISRASAGGGHRHMEAPQNTVQFSRSRFLVRMITLILFFILINAVWSDVSPVDMRIPQKRAWVGQRVPFFIELRVKGSFAGPASFDLPEIPGALLLKVGNPVVGSQNLEGESWFVQTHEFALFSQKTGEVTISAFSVRFASRDGFTGPEKDVTAEVPSRSVEIQRPPGSDGVGFLITTEALEVVEFWEPSPGATRVGATFKRTITQRAPQQSGMALAPFPTNVPDGIRLYPGDVETNDQLSRGDFLGERRETVTYLVQKSGTLTLPAITYVWWNPAIRKMESQTLPEVTLEVAPGPYTTGAESAKPGFSQGGKWGIIAVVALMVLGIWQRRRISVGFKLLLTKFNPPEKVAARALLLACGQNDSGGAEGAWHAWRNLHSLPFHPTSELGSAILELQRYIYGSSPTGTWDGSPLADAFKNHRGTTRKRRGRRDSLPPLNG